MNDECQMTNDELPDSWVRAPFSAVTVDPIQRVPGEKEKITYIDIGSVDRDTKTIVEPQTMLGKDAPSRARKVIQTGDVLVSTVRPNLNAVALVQSQYDGQFASTGFDVLRSPVVDSRWLFYSVRTPEFLDRMSELVQGALYPAVRSKDIRSFVIPIAPLAEQKRIADKLEAVLGRVDACRARLDRVPALLKRFRQSVLAAATSGCLTEEWREEDIERATVPLRDAIKAIRTGPFGSSLHKADYVSGGTPIVNPMHINDGKIFPSDGMTVDEPTLKRLSDFIISTGDVIIGRRGEMGRCAVVTHAEDGWLCGTGSIVLTPRPELDADYLQIFLSSPATVHALEGESVGSTMVNLNQKILLGLEIFFPPLPEQQEIVRRVEALFAFADRIEARLANAQKTVERLTPATLAKAFRGELVPQDPNDEPASALLENLRSTESTTPAGRGRRKAAKKAY